MSAETIVALVVGALVTGMVGLMMRRFERLLDRLDRLEQSMAALVMEMRLMAQGMAAIDKRLTEVEKDVDDIRIAHAANHPRRDPSRVVS